MEIHTLCDEIQLQPEIKSRVFDFVNAFDFTAVDRQLIALRDYEKMSEALAELQTILGEDTDNIKILACISKYLRVCSKRLPTCTIFTKKWVSATRYISQQ